ncbi:hypothetical protein SDC9_144469 [bioreactor metagenome]|uniref:Uncharacterized protein n=1 Tax=bioreactor metagenome TaxID=1076179 RepID=A0A645E6V5_9ZZZZ
MCGASRVRSEPCAQVVHGGEPRTGRAVHRQTRDRSVDRGFGNAGLGNTDVRNPGLRNPGHPRQCRNRVDPDERPEGEAVAHHRQQREGDREQRGRQPHLALEAGCPERDVVCDRRQDEHVQLPERHAHHGRDQRRDEAARRLGPRGRDGALQDVLHDDGAEQERHGHAGEHGGPGQPEQPHTDRLDHGGDDCDQAGRGEGRRRRVRPDPLGQRPVAEVQEQQPGGHRGDDGGHHRPDVERPVRVESGDVRRAALEGAVVGEHQIGDDRQPVRDEHQQVAAEHRRGDRPERLAAPDHRQ